MAATRRLTELAGSALTRTSFPPGPVTVALSGGADSAALAVLAVRSGLGVSLVHVHHGLDASDMLAAAASEIAGRLGLPLETVSVAVREGASLEAKARDARYEALANVAGPVVTGHTRDDAVETMLLNLVRGTGVDGLTGIPYHRPPNVYRPVLEISRSETREIAALADLPFRDDPANEVLDLTRNRIRHVVLPRLRELNPNLDETMARAASALRGDRDLLDQMASTALWSELETSVVSTLPAPIADRVVMRWLAAQDVEVSADVVARVWSVVSGDSDRQDLDRGRSVVRDRAVVRVE